MGLTRTLGTIVTLCQQRSDKENDGQLGTAEWKSLVSELYAELHKCVSEKGARYFESEATITATGASSYSLPADHLSTIGVDLVLDSAGRRRELDEIMVQERVLWSGLTGEAFAYELSGSTIVLFPNPTSGTYKHLYVPQPTDYSSSADGTSVDLISIDGLKFLVWGVASIALHKSESAQQRAVMERDKAYESLEYWAALRSLNNPRRRPDVDSRGVFDPADWRWRAYR